MADDIVPPVGDQEHAPGQVARVLLARGQMDRQPLAHFGIVGPDRAMEGQSQFLPNRGQPAGDQQFETGQGRRDQAHGDGANRTGTCMFPD
ncbi:MAG: hypothetical protein IPI73_18955 [Betaproteobacteria bacterium]|nr:hypothetical protein [Betaproteobacteria bacterium]